MSEIQPALFTRSEIEWLLGNKRVSKLYERKIRHFIKKKIQSLTELEIPLLLDRGFNITTYTNGVTADGNTSELRGSPSLVGRGIANPDKGISDVREKETIKKRGEWEFRPILRNFEPTCPFGHGISNPHAVFRLSACAE